VLLYPMDEATRSIADLQSRIKGLFDLEAAVDSPEAAAVRQSFASLQPQEVGAYIEDLTRYAVYCHGTHVSGIAVAENPAARILVSRLTADVHMIPEAPTLELATRAGQAMRDAVRYYQAHGVRVVNMSWVIAASEFENDLEKNGIGETPEERRTLAREMFALVKQGLYDALAGAPDILFVGGAGNDNNDIEFDEFVPPMFQLPNLLIAGAVDQAGDPTGFTSFGPTVNVYANGFEVDSYVPGGDRLAFSGTSMAAPNVTNLAAKLLALESGLTPPEVIELILAGADERYEGEQLLRIIHPQRSVELLKRR
jgi:subtilisin family serine protease